MRITSKIIEALSNKYTYIELSDNYGEPGYTLPSGKQGILLANWNKVPKHIGNALEKQFELEWFDEWVIKHSLPHSLAYRSKPNSYSWTPSYIETEYESIFTRDNAKSDIESYIEMLDHVPSKIDIFDLNWPEYGFTILEDDYESGWYGQENSPDSILEAIDRLYPNHTVIFCQLSNEQFRSNWKVAIKAKI